MNARRLVLPAVVAAVIVTGGCTKPKPGEDSRPEAPPQAPPPRAKGEKTKADMLVGKWKRVSAIDENGTPLPLAEGYKSTVEYTADGKVTIWTDNPATRPTDPDGNPHVMSRTYLVEGDRLISTFETPRKPLEITKTIISITKDKLTTIVRPSEEGSGGHVIGEYERIPQKL